jgi:hypothetical protein
MTKFSVSKKGKYFELKYFNSKDIWCSTRNSVETLIVTILQYEELFKELIKKYNFDFSEKDVIDQYFEVLDSIASGLDIRSKMPPEELAYRFIISYNDKLNDAKIFCLETLKFIDESSEKDTYNKDYKRYDKCNDLNTKFKFGLPMITMDSFKINPFKMMGEALDLLNELIKKRKNE